ncbi:cytochrome P450 78A7-like [Senna tora]|uniref:Cytochrome P450 78A7-like n=1 Tax=Senna tora TaxID=362788 RepID=A0A834W9I5_9FABA|nr:cytochrome P450 78A7-like [Senna tora]
MAHRSLASLAWARPTTHHLMAFTLGFATLLVVASHPTTVREILTSPHFADRPLKQSAKSLMFSRAIGFAPNGTYWRLLRRIASSHLFSPRRIIAHEPGCQLECAAMLRSIATQQKLHRGVTLRKHLQAADLNNIMSSVFGKRYEPSMESHELDELRDMIREGFELLGNSLEPSLRNTEPPKPETSLITTISSMFCFLSMVTHIATISKRKASKVGVQSMNGLLCFHPKNTICFSSCSDAFFQGHNGGGFDAVFPASSLPLHRQSLLFSLLLFWSCVLLIHSIAYGFVWSC